MPYIPEAERAPLDQAFPVTAGELNYSITLLCDNYLAYKCALNERVGYREINEVVGVLECAKLEFYRRIAAPYEDKKMQENGDVYTVKP